MADTSDQQDKPFVGEPVEPLDGPPLLRRVARWVRKQGLPGPLALAEGLALLGLFCFSPWFSWYGVNIGLGVPTTPAAWHALSVAFGPHFYSGWAMALGISIPDEPSPFFGYLWLILLIGLALVCLAGLRLWRLFSTRQALATLLALSGLALLIEAGLLLQTHQFPEPLLSGFSNPYNDAYIATGLLWGFWGGVGVNASAIAAGVALFKPTPPGRHALKIAESAV